MHNIERSQIIVMKCIRRMCSNDTLCILGKKPIFKAMTRLCFYATVGLKLLPLLIFKLDFIVFYYIHRYLLFILVYFDAVIDVVIVGRCCCHFSPFTLAFFLFSGLLLLFLTLFPWYISFWQQNHIYIHINLYKCKYEYRHDLSVQFEWRMKKRHAYTVPALALSLSNWEWRERVYGVHMS